MHIDCNPEQISGQDKSSQNPSNTSNSSHRSRHYPGAASYVESAQMPMKLSIPSRISDFPARHSQGDYLFYSLFPLFSAPFFSRQSHLIVPFSFMSAEKFIFIQCRLPLGYLITLMSMDHISLIPIMNTIEGFLGQQPIA